MVLAAVTVKGVPVRRIAPPLACQPPSALPASPVVSHGLFLPKGASKAEFGKHEYAGLAQISVAHPYRLRQSKSYRTRRMHFTKTKPTPVAIGERRGPEPEGRPGYLRVDPVHEGDRAGVKDFAALPITEAVDGVGNSAGFLARVNFLREEPVGAKKRWFANHLNGPLYICDRI